MTHNSHHWNQHISCSESGFACWGVSQHPLLVANSNDLRLLGNQEREPVDSNCVKLEIGLKAFCLPERASWCILGI